MFYAGDRMILTADDLGLFLRLMIARAGGSATFTFEDRDLQQSDSLMLFIEATDDGRGLTLSVHRVDEEHAGHA